MLYVIQSILYITNVATADNFLNEINDFINLLPSWDEKLKEWLIANPSKTVVAITQSKVTPEAIEYIDEVIAKKNGKYCVGWR